MPKIPLLILKSSQKLTDFINTFSRYTSTKPGLKCYRGQNDATWKTVAGLFRPGMSNLANNEKRAIRDLISVHPQEFEHDETMFDKLVRMQHYGLPTRLLDVSMNALVALYFATEKGENGTEDGLVLGFSVPEEREKYFDSDSVSCLANLANMTETEKKAINHLRTVLKASSKAAQIKEFNDSDAIKRLHHFIKSEKPYFLPIINPVDLFKPYFVHPKLSNRRILAQAGAFIIYGIEPPIRLKFMHPISTTKFMVACDAKASIRKELENLGINESTLFPEIDKAAKRIKNEYSR